MLEYIYCDFVDLTRDLALDLVLLSDQYSLPGLKEVCEGFLCQCLSIDNFVIIAQISDEAKSSTLTDAIIGFIRENVSSINERDDLFDLPKSILLACLFKGKSK